MHVHLRRTLARDPGGSVGLDSWLLDLVAMCTRFGLSPAGAFRLLTHPSVLETKELNVDVVLALTRCRSVHSAGAQRGDDLRDGWLKHDAKQSTMRARCATQRKVPRRKRDRRV
jgi:hypothetical protein